MASENSVSLLELASIELRKLLDNKPEGVLFAVIMNPNATSPELIAWLKKIFKTHEDFGTKSKLQIFEEVFHFFSVGKTATGHPIVSFNKEAFRRSRNSYGGGGSGGRSYGGGGSGGRGYTKHTSRSCETVERIDDLLKTKGGISFKNLFENTGLQAAMLEEYGWGSDEETFLEIIRVLGYKFSPSTGYVTNPEYQTRAEGPSPESRDPSPRPESRALSLRVPSPSPEPELD
jgi:hypothetical protein